MSLKITTLIENMPDDKGKLVYEHGFSALVEVDGIKILFDTGQTGDFLKNADVMDVDLSELDAVVLSHGHYDHTGGVPKLLSGLKKRTPFYIGREFFCPKYKLLEDGTYKYNGNPFRKEELLAEDHLAEVRFVSENVTELFENVYLFKNFKRITEYETVNPKFFVRKEQGYEQDFFIDEIALGIRSKEGLVLIVGCSHVGIVNILEHIKKETNLTVAAVLGGTHLVEADERRLEQTAEALKQYGVKLVAVSHCTGEAGMKLLQQEFGEGFVRNNTGNILSENT